MGSIVHQVAVNKLYGWSFLAVSTHQTYNFMQMVKFRCWFLSNTLNQGGHIIFKCSLFSEDIMMFSIMYRDSPTYMSPNNANLTYVPFCHLSSWVDYYTNTNFAQLVSSEMHVGSSAELCTSSKSMSANPLFCMEKVRGQWFCWIVWGYYNHHDIFWEYTTFNQTLSKSLQLRYNVVMHLAARAHRGN